MNGTCQSCKHYSAMSSECRRHAPKVFILGMHPQKGALVDGFHPPTKPDHWCGEHEAELAVPIDSAARAARQSM